MAATLPVDMELKKAFQELHAKMLETTQKLKLADIQIDSLKRAKQHATLTTKEISDYPDETPMYKQIGRLFVYTDKNEMISLLDKRTKKMDSKIQELEANKQYLERNMKESEENLRELVASKQRER